MNKKKIGALLVAGVLTLGVVGGTLAWFTSGDCIRNIFETGGLLDPSENPDVEEGNGNGVEIWENFGDPDTVRPGETTPDNVVPGDRVTKVVQVQNTTTYDSFIRVKLTPQWIEAGSEVESIDDLKEEMIILNFGKDNENINGTDGKWLDGGDGYYYYMGKVASAGFTSALLESVTLSEEAGNEYRDAKFTVLVEAESIQADNDAHNDAWFIEDENGEKLPTEATAKLDEYEGKAATSADKIDDVTVTDTEER